MGGLSSLITMQEMPVIEQAKGITTLLNNELFLSFMSKGVLRKVTEEFEKLTSYVYVVEVPEKRKRRSYKEEIANPHQYLYVDAVQHSVREGMYKDYALVLWAVTGYSFYAKKAGLQLKYAQVGKKTESNAIDVMFEREAELINALTWWLSAERLKEIGDSLKEARDRTANTVYKSNPSKSVVPYIDWEIAAKAVIGLRVGSKESNRSIRQYQYGKELRPDEKAGFIRDYIAAEKRAEGAVSDNAAREMEGICKKIKQYGQLYPLFGTEKIQNIIAMLSRSDYLRVSERQAQYLRRVLQDAETYHDIQSKVKVGADLFDIDDFLEEQAKEQEKK